MLSSDVLILEVLNEAKNNGNEILKNFHIQFPSKRLAQESNNIFVACVNSENNLDGYDFTTFTDLVEVLVVIKKLDYEKSVNVIKTVSYEICKLIYESIDKFPNKPIIRNINPEYNYDFVLNRGHILIEINTTPINFEIDDETYDCVCKILAENIEVE